MAARNINIFLPPLAAALVMSGCNTVPVVGKDLKHGGDAIERAAEK